jgi:transcriptional regulator
MYTPEHFDESRPEVLHALMREHPFGLLVTQSSSGLAANGIPFLFDAQRGPLGTLRAHVARANPVWREARTDVESLVVFQGPQAYVSPSWYATKARTGMVVPTWNYMMVQARGRLQVRDDPQWLLQLVSELTERHESGRDAPWKVADAPETYIQGLLKAIVGLEIELASLDGKWKVSQNRPAADREGVVSGLVQQGTDMALAMAAQVKQSGNPG